MAQASDPGGNPPWWPLKWHTPTFSAPRADIEIAGVLFRVWREPVGYEVLERGNRMTYDTKEIDDLVTLKCVLLEIKRRITHERQSEHPQP